MRPFVLFLFLFLSPVTQACGAAVVHLVNQTGHHLFNAQNNTHIAPNEKVKLEIKTTKRELLVSSPCGIQLFGNHDEFRPEYLVLMLMLKSEIMLEQAVDKENWVVSKENGLIDLYKMFDQEEDELMFPLDL